VTVVIRGVATAGANATTTSATRAPGVPAGTTPGDMLLLHACWSGSTVTITDPTGWTLVYHPATSQQTNDNAALYARIADGSATDSPTLTISVAASFVASCLALGGTNGTLPSPGTTAQVQLGGAASTTITYPAITPSTANDLLVEFTGLRPSTATTQVTAVVNTGGTGGTVTKQSDICTNISGVAESEDAVITQQLTASTAISSQTATVSTTVSSVIISVVVTPANTNPDFALANQRKGRRWTTGQRQLQLKPVWFGSASSAPANVAGVVANVNVSGQSDNTVTVLENGVGQTATANVAAQPGTINIYQNFDQPFPFPPVLDNSIQFISAFAGLRVQYNTALPDVFVPGSQSSVSVTSPSGSLLETITGSQGIVNVAAPSGSVPFALAGSVSTVNVAGAADNIVTEIILGAASVVNVSAPAGSLSITTSIPPQFPQPPILPNAIRFIPAFAGLRVQYNTGSPVIGTTPGNVNGVTGQVTVVALAGSLSDTLSGTVGNVNVAAIAGQTTEPLTGVTGQVNVAAQAGQISVTLSGAVSNVNTAALSGSLSSNFTGVVSLVNTSPQSGSVGQNLAGIASSVSVASAGSLLVSVINSPAAVNVVAPPEATQSQDVVIQGASAIVNITAGQGYTAITNVYNWWRVYPAYRSDPVW
jgi:hypothetical protein